MFEAETHAESGNRALEVRQMSKSSILGFSPQACEARNGQGLLTLMAEPRVPLLIKFQAGTI